MPKLKVLFVLFSAYWFLLQCSANAPELPAEQSASELIPNVEAPILAARDSQNTATLQPPNIEQYDYDTSQWTELIALEPSIRLDLRYATTNNFMEQQIYDCGRCFYRKQVAAALVKVQSELSQKGLGLKMYDCYRPAPYQQRLWDILPDARYVARPEKGSLHSRGAAADLTVVNLKTGEELDMGTPYDFFGPAAYTTTTDLPSEVLENRTLLQNAMRNYGFGTIRTEWWHFNYLGPRLAMADWVWPCES